MCVNRLPDYLTEGPAHQALRVCLLQIRLPDVIEQYFVKSLPFKPLDMRTIILLF